MMTSNNNNPKNFMTVKHGNSEIRYFNYHAMFQTFVRRCIYAPLRIFRCTRMWVAALFFSIIKELRVMYKKPGNRRENRIVLTGLICDFIAAINSLPKGFLWSNRLSTKTSATFSLIASLIGFYKLF